MRFSFAISPAQQPQPVAADAAFGMVQDEMPARGPVSAPPPWPADSPPDDLDQRVRQVGEWQLGDW